MTPVSFALIGSVSAFAGLVTVLRLVFLHDSVADRIINRSIGLAALGMFFAMATVDSDLPVEFTHLGGAIGFLTASAVLGSARLLDGADPGGAPARQRRYDRGAGLGIAITATIDVAHFAGLCPAAAPKTWYATAAASACLPLAVSGVLLIRAGMREVLSAQNRIAPKIAFAVLVGVAGFWLCYATILVARYCVGDPLDNPGAVWTVTSFLFLAVITALLAIPLVRMALVHAGWDKDSRDCRTLELLWTDLVAAVPHVTLVPDRADDRSPALRRYRMGIEIRDALLQLRRHAGDYPPDDPRGRILRVVRAAEDGLVTAPRPRDHDSELRHLLGLAARWPQVRGEYAPRDGDRAARTGEFAQA
ncbi:DUF6545 domain-containing protein [Nocardia takedensis]